MLRAGLIAAVAMALAPVPAFAADASGEAAADSAGNGSSARIDPTRLAIANQIVTIIYPVDYRNAAVNDMIEQQPPGVAHVLLEAALLDPGLGPVVTREMTSLSDRVRAMIAEQLNRRYDAVARAYARAYSKSELHTLLSLARMPVWQSYLRSDPTIVNCAEVTQSTQDMLTYADNLQQANLGPAGPFAAYLAQHPDFVAKMQIAEAARVARLNAAIPPPGSP